MKKRVLLQTAVLLAATVNLSEVAASCFPPAKGQTPLDVLKCLQSELDSQQKRIAELEKENRQLQAHNWGAEGWTSGTTSIPLNAWKKLQSVDLPTSGKYLVIANYRIRRDGHDHGFVKAELRWNDGSAKKTESRMICEGISPGKPHNFTNYGGSVSWVIEVATATTLEAWYFSFRHNHYRWYNDHNGVPRLIAVRLY